MYILLYVMCIEKINVKQTIWMYSMKVVSDPEYMVAIKAVKLKRQVEMFQWVEHKSERYDKSWKWKTPSLYSKEVFIIWSTFLQSIISLVYWYWPAAMTKASVGASIQATTLSKFL